MLSAFEELNSVEIAEVLGITESSVRSRLFRARNLMAELLNHSRSHPMNSDSHNSFQRRTERILAGSAKQLCA